MIEAIRIAIAVLITAVVGFFFGVKTDNPAATVPASGVVQAEVPNTTVPKSTTTEKPVTPDTTAKPDPKPTPKPVQKPVAVVVPKPVQKPTPTPKPTENTQPVQTSTPENTTYIQPTTTAATTTTTQPEPVVTPKPSLTGHYYGKCPVFPADHPYNTDISSYPVHPKSAEYIARVNEMGTRKNIHPDFGGYGKYGMPVNYADKNTPWRNIHFTAYGNSSDPGPYPMPLNTKVQPNDDRHVTILDTENCKLYEMFYAWEQADKSWNAHAGAIWDLTKIHRRPLGWTSADGAGMAIYPLVIKYDEVQAGAVNHAIRMTVPKTYKGFIWPANHQAGADDPTLPPMGLRFRLKADYDISGFPYEAKVILTAMKKYGMIVAQNGSSWVIGGEQDPRWNEDHLRTLKSVPSSALEVVYTGEIITDY